jgi:adenylate kinase
MTHIILFGPPGAGKGTQAERIRDNYNFLHISTGDVFRYNIKNETALGKRAKSFIDRGELVPDDVTIKMLAGEMRQADDKNGIIFDGFPRTKAQAKALDDLLNEQNEKIDALISLDVDDNILIERLKERGKTSGRKDDADENVIRNRIQVYYTETEVVKEHYNEQNKLQKVDGVGDIEAITKRLNKVIDQLI